MFRAATEKMEIRLEFIVKNDKRQSSRYDYESDYDLRSICLESFIIGFASNRASDSLSSDFYYEIIRFGFPLFFYLHIFRSIQVSDERLAILLTR